MSKTLKILSGGLAVASAVFAASAVAVPITGVNVRPTTINPAPGAELSVQQILDVFAPGENAVTGQEKAAAWAAAAQPASTIPTMVVEYSGNAAINALGIWFGTDTTNIFKYDLLFGPAFGNINPASPRSAAGLQIFNGSLEVLGSANPASPSTCGSEVNCGFVANALINPNFFGFYLSVGNNTYYSADVLNANGEARMLAYETTPTNWLMFFEDGTDFDFNDLSVKVESIRPVPEPASLAIAGIAFLGAGFVARRRQRGQA